MSDIGTKFCSEISDAKHKLVDRRKLTTSPYHWNGNEGVERANQSMAQTPAIAMNKKSNDWDLQLPP